MKFWVKARVQCEAEEVLGVICDRSMEAEVLQVVGAAGGGGYSLLGGRPAVTLNINLPFFRPLTTDEPWAATLRHPGGAPCFFCPEHADEGVKMVDGGGHAGKLRGRGSRPGS